VTADSVTIGMAIAPNATGAVLATSATAAAFIGLNPSARSMTDVMATGVPKPASASSSAPEAERDDDCLDALVVGDPRERTAQHDEVAVSTGHVVDPDRVDDDPHDRPQAETRALERRVDGLADRHPVDRDPLRQTLNPRAAISAAHWSRHLFSQPPSKHEQR
jgi:hypothetical protein